MINFDFPGVASPPATPPMIYSYMSKLRSSRHSVVVWFVIPLAK